MPPKKASAQTKTNNKKAPVTQKPAPKPSAKVAPKPPSKSLTAEQKKKNLRKTKAKIVLGFMGIQLLVIGAVTASYISYDVLKNYVISKSARRKFDVEMVLDKFVKDEEPTQECRGNLSITMGALSSVISAQTRIDKNIHVLRGEILLKNINGLIDFDDPIKNVLKGMNEKEDASVILGFLGIEASPNSRAGHANVVTLITNESEGVITMERFDPNGATYDSRVEMQVDARMRLLADEFGKLRKMKCVYKNLYETVSCPRFPQSRVRAHTESLCPEGGFCVVFSAMYIHMRALYPDKSPSEIINSFYYTMTSEKLHLTMRKYYSKIELLGWPILRENVLFGKKEYLRQAKILADNSLATETPTDPTGILIIYKNGLVRDLEEVQGMMEKFSHVEKRLDEKGTYPEYMKNNNEARSLMEKALKRIPLS